MRWVRRTKSEERSAPCIVCECVGMRALSPLMGSTMLETGPSPSMLIRYRMIARIRTDLSRTRRPARRLCAPPTARLIASCRTAGPKSPRSASKFGRMRALGAPPIPGTGPVRSAPSGDASASARGRTVGRFSHLRADRHGSESSARAGRPYACRADLRRGIGCIHGGKGPSIQSSSAQRTAVARRLVGSRFSSRALPPYH